MRSRTGGSLPTILVVAAVPALALAACVGGPAAPATAQEGVSPDPFPGATVVELPARCDGHRFWVTPATADGDTLSLFTDTGGGAVMVFAGAVERLGLATTTVSQPQGGEARIAALPALAPDAAIPLPSPASPTGHWLLVRERPSHLAGDGFLGRTWFAGRVWALDYPGCSLGLVAGWDPEGLPAGHRVPLGFQADSAGRRTTHFPRLRVEVDGDSLDLLFDTGATVRLTDGARADLDAGGRTEQGTSFIVRSVYEEWRRRHPDWRVIRDAERETGASMIRVPEISLAGHTVGPVWFTVRPDANFREGMSRWMDREVDGALGGSALHHFRVLVDYPRATAVFLRP